MLSAGAGSVPLICVSLGAKGAAQITLCSCCSLGGVVKRGTGSVNPAGTLLQPVRGSRGTRPARTGSSRRGRRFVVEGCHLPKGCEVLAPSSATPQQCSSFSRREFSIF